MSSTARLIAGPDQIDPGFPARAAREGEGHARDRAADRGPFWGDLAACASWTTTPLTWSSVPFRERRTAADFGMTDGRKSGSVPTEPWKLLGAMAKNGGRLTWSGAGASDKARWYIKHLRDGISAVLPLEGSPIREYSVGRAG
jgi:hypothetical protein